MSCLLDLTVLLPAAIAVVRLSAHFQSQLGAPISDILRGGRKHPTFPVVVEHHGTNCDWAFVCLLLVVASSKCVSLSAGIADAAWSGGISGRRQDCRVR